MKKCFSVLFKVYEVLCYHPLKEDFLIVMWEQIIIWDNDGTIQGSKDPNDPTKIILPNVESTMKRPGVLNIICSGCKTPESEVQNFDPQKVASRLQSLMDKLPIQVATFSTAIGGVECYVVLKKKKGYEIRKAHEEPSYKHLIGQFKKPGIGMFLL